MSEKYYTVDEIAEVLKIHPKTIQRYIREGKLNANKVGKSWRVSGHDLSVFTEGYDAVQNDMASDGHFDQKDIKVSSVIDVPVANTEESIRISNMLTAVLNSKPADYAVSSLRTQYLLPEGIIRVMLWGDLRFTRIVMDYLSGLIDQHSTEGGETHV